MKRKLTVTIPSYRQPVQLKRALSALSTQTFKDFSVIIIDDNSGVDIIDAVKEYQSVLDISIIKNEINLGAMQNMLKSITLKVESDYIFSHHEDDYIKCNYLEEAVAVLDTNPHVSFVLSSAVWIAKDTPYEITKIQTPALILLSSHDFMIKSLKREPFIFGSVIYRKKDVTATFELQTYHTLCDKIFLTEILINNTSLCGYIKEPAIYVRDHTLDEKDQRSDGATINHVINFFNFYKTHLPNTKEVQKLITNTLLLGYNNLQAKTSFFELYSKQKKYNLLSLSLINMIGVYSLVSLLLGKKIAHSIIKSRTLKKLVTV